MPPVTESLQPTVPPQPSRRSVSLLVCLALVVVFAILSSGGVYLFLRNNLKEVPAPVVVAPVVTAPVPSLLSAEEKALLFIKDITATSSNKVSTSTIASLSLLLNDAMYKTAILPDKEEAKTAVSFATTSSSLQQSGTVVSGDTSSVQVQVCYDAACFKAYHYYVTLVVENGAWSVAGVTFTPEARE